MRFASLGSGSRGNATVVQDRGTLMIDCGFNLAQTVERLKRLGLEPQDLDAILVTHEHSDHASGVARFARQFGIEVYLTSGTAKAIQADMNSRFISSHRTFSVAGFVVRPVVVPHDAREPVQFVVESAGAAPSARLGVLTDAGHITPFMLDAYRHCDALLLEYNHDADLLWNGRYPPMLKQRVGGPHGHLNNEQASQLLAAVHAPRLKHVVLAHLSEANNTLMHAQAAAMRLLTGSGSQLLHASQDQGCDWIEMVAD